MIRLSIIIPFYNVEQYIAQCLDSVYKQDIPETEYEVICVNDASPDKSREIVLEYQKKHSNLVLVEHDVNKKLGAARNTGRSVARGTYIWNVDSDDMIAPNCLSEVLDICEKGTLDVLVFGHQNVVNDAVVKPDERDVIPATLRMSGIEFMRQYGISHLYAISPVWRQIFRKEFLDKKGIYSLPVNMSEDVPYTYNALVHAQKLQVSDKPYYFYRCNSQSIGEQMLQSPSAINAYESCFVVPRELFRIADELRAEAPDVCKAIQQVGTWCFQLYGKYAERMTKEQHDSFLSICRRKLLNNVDVLFHLGHKKRKAYIKFVVFG